MDNDIDFLLEALKIKEELIALRRDFHRHPELGYEEHRTSNKIKEFLKKEQIEYFESAITGICAIIRGNGDKTVALRADIDALPLEDRKKCSYSSVESGKMHGCGHDAHTTILMGAAKLLNENKHLLKGNVKLLFEPAEETTGGAKIMIKEGVLSSPEVNGIIGLHVDERVPVGSIAIKKGVVNASSNPFTVKIKGKGGHGAKPSDTIDPVVIASSIILALQNIASREIPPTDAVVISIGTVHGGTAQNIIPEEVVFSGIIRTMKKEHREYVKKRFKEVVEGISSTMRGTAEIEIEESYPCLYNDDNMLKFLENSATKIIGKEKIIKLDAPYMSVESFAYFSMEKPSAFYYLGIRNEEKGTIYPLHSSFFDLDEDALPIGVAVQCQAAFDFLC